MYLMIIVLPFAIMPLIFLRYSNIAYALLHLDYLINCTIGLLGKLLYELTI